MSGRVRTSGELEQLSELQSSSGGFFASHASWKAPMLSLNSLDRPVKICPPTWVVWYSLQSIGDTLDVAASPREYSWRRQDKAKDGD